MSLSSAAQEILSDEDKQDSTYRSLTLVKDTMQHSTAQHSTASVTPQHIQHSLSCTTATKAEVNAHELW